MKPYLFSLGAGLIVGVVYHLLNVRSPAPPVIALLGLLGILVGEQLIPAAKRIVAWRTGEAVAGSVRSPDASAESADDRPGGSR